MSGLINMCMFVIYLGDLPVSFSATELGDGEHNFTIVATANGVTVIRTIIVTVTRESNTLFHVVYTWQFLYVCPVQVR